MSSEKELRAKLTALNITFKVTQKHAGNSYYGPLKKVYVDRVPLDQTAFNRLGFMLIKSIDLKCSYTKDDIK